jgi:hypothetical protein
MARNLGAHVPPVTLRQAGSKNPMESPLNKFSRKKASGASRGPENLIEEEVAMCNYPLKSRN